MSPLNHGTITISLDIQLILTCQSFNNVVDFDIWVRIDISTTVTSQLLPMSILPMYHLYNYVVKLYCKLCQLIPSLDVNSTPITTLISESWHNSGTNWHGHELTWVRVDQYYTKHIKRANTVMQNHRCFPPELFSYKISLDCDVKLELNYDRSTVVGRL